MDEVQQRAGGVSYAPSSPRGVLRQGGGAGEAFKEM